MAKKAKKRCCPCPLDAARAKVREAKTCDEMNKASDAWMAAAFEELDARPEGVAKDRYSRLLDAEFDRVTQKASVRCTYPSKSDKAVRAIAKAQLGLRKAKIAAERLLANTQRQNEAAIRKAVAAQAAATQLQGLRRRRSLSPF